jgi:hypothetical protein
MKIAIDNHEVLDQNKQNTWKHLVLQVNTMLLTNRMFDFLPNISLRKKPDLKLGYFKLEKR